MKFEYIYQPTDVCETHYEIIHFIQEINQLIFDQRKSMKQLLLLCTLWHLRPLRTNSCRMSIFWDTIF